jgi:hypothetical protein
MGYGMKNFYHELVEISKLPSVERRVALLNLHQRVYETYVEALQQITEKGASRVVPDGRTVSQVVAHILEWDRAAMIAFGEILSGVEWPRLMSGSFNTDFDGKTHEFANVDDFNAHYAQVYAGESWDTIRTKAKDIARVLLQLFESPSLVTAERLDRTGLFDRYRLPTGVNLSLPCGWYLWMITVEHEGIEHAEDLQMGFIDSNHSIVKTGSV